MPVLLLQHVQKNYHDHPVLHEIDLTVTNNEIFGLIGLNGSGKTSLLKCILALHDISAGAIEIFALPHFNKSARANLVYLPEKFNPPEYMSGAEYLKWVVDSHRIIFSQEALNAKLDELLLKVDLHKAALKKLVKHYSKGMVQKLGIIACLLSGKDLLIMDEPMSGLDPKARALFRKVVQELKLAGKTVFLCTHILSDIERLCDKIGIMHEGRLLFVGSPVACCEQYQADTLEQAFLKSIEVKV